jgi:hypothetical protein
MRMLSAAAAIAALTIVVPSASAATPSQGEVSASQPTQSWAGEAYGQPMKLGGPTQTHALCIAPFCDTFSLTVKDAGALRVTLTAPTSASFVDVLITAPDGTTEFLEGNDTDVFQERTYKTAKLGVYTFDIWPNAIFGVYDGQYSGDAALCPAPTPFAECFVVPEEDV